MDHLFFRFDASPVIGLGHLRRCCVLAQACAQAGAEPHFFIRQQGLDLSSQEFPQGSVIHQLPWESTEEQEAEWMLRTAATHDLQMGVVDHYRFSAAYQQRLNMGGLRWMQFGNPLHTHPLLGAWVHDASPGAAPAAYSHRLLESQIPPVFLTGPEHALVGEAFVLERSRHSPPTDEPIERLLLTFGGGDDRGAALAALTWLDLAGYAGTKVLLTTRLNTHLPILQQKAAGRADVELHVDNWSPAPIMAGCQLALCAGGTSLHELACLGVPPVIISIADNQLFPSRAWAGAGMAINLGLLDELTQDQAVSTLQSVFARPEQRLALAQHCWEAQDGQGAVRVAAALMAADN